MEPWFEMTFFRNDEDFVSENSLKKWVQSFAGHFLLNSLEIILVFEQLSAFHLKLSQDSLQNILVSDEIIPVSVQIIHVSMVFGQLCWPIGPPFLSSGFPLPADVNRTPCGGGVPGGRTHTASSRT